MLIRITLILAVCAIAVAAGEEAPSCNGSVSPSEVAEITSVICEVTSEPIQDFGRCGDGTVFIRTFQSSGPRSARADGSGQVFRLRKDDGKWKIIKRVFYAT
jgi:hypothetical protein